MKHYICVVLSFLATTYATPIASIQWSNCNSELQEYFGFDSEIGLSTNNVDTNRPRVHGASSFSSQRQSESIMDKLKRLEKELSNSESNAPFYIDEDPMFMLKQSKLEKVRAVLQILQKQQQGLLRLQCGSFVTTFDPQFNPDTVSNQNIKLSVYRISKTNIPDNERTHYWGLQGGPGGSGLGLTWIVNIWDSENLATDYFIPDHRGTGFSNFVHCPYGLEYSYVDECAMNQCTDVSDFSITNAATDLKALIDSAVKDSPVKPKRVTVHGLSYGTSWGQRYLQLFPKSHVSKFILEGVVDPNGLYLNMFHRASQRVGELLLEKCAMDNQCKEAFPNGFESMKDRMNTFILENNPGNATDDYDIRNECISLFDIRWFMRRILRQYTYTSNGFNLRPVALAYVHRALRCNEDDKRAILNLREYFQALNNIIDAPRAANPTIFDRLDSDIVYLSIGYAELTTDTYPSFEEYIKEFEHNYFFTPDSASEYEYSYQHYLKWDKYELDQYAKSYFTEAETDVLFVNGEMDVQTPDSSAKSTFINSATKDGYSKILAISPNGGHTPSSEELPCVRSIISEFLSLPKGQSPDLSCTLGISSPDLNTVPALLDFTLPESITGTSNIFGDSSVIDVTKENGRYASSFTAAIEQSCDTYCSSDIPSAFECIMEGLNSCQRCIEFHFLTFLCGDCEYHCGLTREYCSNDEIEALGCSNSTEEFNLCETEAACTFSDSQIESYMNCLRNDNYGSESCSKCDPHITECMEKGCTAAPCLLFEKFCPNEPVPNVCTAPTYDVCTSCNATMGALERELASCQISDGFQSCSSCLSEFTGIVDTCTTNCEGQCDMLDELCPSTDPAPFNCTGSPLGECDRCDLISDVTNVNLCLEFYQTGADKCDVCLKPFSVCEGKGCLSEDLCKPIYEHCGSTYTEKYNCDTFSPTYSPIFFTPTHAPTTITICELEELPTNSTNAPTSSPNAPTSSPTKVVQPETNDSMLTIILITVGVVGSLGLVASVCMVSQKKAKNAGRLTHDVKYETENPLANPL